MKKQLVMLVGFSVICGSPFLKAGDQVAETAVIPFEFQAGDVRFPAGKYHAELMNSAGMIVLRNQEKGISKVFSAGVTMGGRESAARLVFHRYGDRYFLSEVWFPQETVGHKALESKVEKEVRIASANGKPDSITLATR